MKKITCIILLSFLINGVEAQIRKIYYPKYMIKTGSFTDFEKTDCTKENKIETCTFLFSDAADEPKKSYIGTFKETKQKPDSWNPRSQIIYEGKGIFTYKNGDTQEGKFSYYYDKKNKSGIYIYTDAFSPANKEFTYKNEVWTFPNGDKLRWPSIYIPEWMNLDMNKVYKQLTYTFSNGDELTSDWNNGIPLVDQAPTYGSFKPFGKYKIDGTYSLANGIIEFRSGDVKLQFESALESLVKCLSGDCITGNGKKKYEKGEIYEGEFVNGKPSGKGTYIGTDYTYTGTFKNGEFFGVGTQVYTNGDSYSSESWTGINKFTNGIRTDKNGKTESGERNFYFLASRVSTDPMVQKATAALTGKGNEGIQRNEKTYVFQSQCANAKGSFNVISKISADLSKHTFDEVEARALHMIANNGWQLQTKLKYLGTSDVVKINGTPGRDYVVSSDSISDFK